MTVKPDNGDPKPDDPGAASALALRPARLLRRALNSAAAALRHALMAKTPSAAPHSPSRKQRRRRPFLDLP